MQIPGHWRIEAPRSLGLGGSATAIYSHSQERRDLFVFGHALSLGGRAAHSIQSNGLVFSIGSLASGEYT
jgi:hypothetical protein